MQVSLARTPPSISHRPQNLAKFFIPPALRGLISDQPDLPAARILLVQFSENPPTLDISSKCWSLIFGIWPNSLSCMQVSYHPCLPSAIFLSNWLCRISPHPWCFLLVIFHPLIPPWSLAIYFLFSLLYSESTQSLSPTTNPIAVDPEPVTTVLNKVCLATLTSIRIVSLTVDGLVTVCQVRLDSCWCLWGLAWWSSGQDLAFLCRGRGFNPWVES